MKDPEPSYTYEDFHRDIEEMNERVGRIVDTVMRLSESMHELLKDVVVLDEDELARLREQRGKNDGQ